MRGRATTDDMISQIYYRIEYTEADIERLRKQQDRIEAMLIGLCLGAKSDLHLSKPKAVTP